MWGEDIRLSNKRRAGVKQELVRMAPKAQRAEVSRWAKYAHKKPLISRCVDLRINPTEWCNRCGCNPFQLCPCPAGTAAEDFRELPPPTAVPRYQWDEVRDYLLDKYDLAPGAAKDRVHRWIATGDKLLG